MPDDVLRRTQELQQRREAFALATVVRVDRPVSARPGDSAVVRTDGRVEGWVGGSCSEPIVVRESLAALTDGQPRLLCIRPPGSPPGTVDQPGVITEITACASEGGLDIFIEPRPPSPLLAVAGSSPAARMLVQLAVPLGYRVVAILDSPTEHVPSAQATMGLDDLEAAELEAQDAVVVATMNRYDESALEAALRTEAGYVGLVASRPRGAKVLEMLRARGASEFSLERIHTPAGIDLGPATQEEIALSVLAEVISVRNRNARAAVPLCEPESRAARAVDPVCGMTVAVVPGVPSVTHEKALVYFCSPNCRSAFLEEPGRYLRPEASEGSVI